MKTITTLALAVSIAIGGVMMTPNAHATGIPVIDGANLGQNMQQLLQMIEQLRQLEAQLSQAKEQYESITGGRGLGGISYEDYLAKVPRNWQETLNVIDSGGQVSGLAKSIAEKASLLEQENFAGVAESVRKELAESMNDTASAQALNAQIYDNTTDRFARLKSLMNQINSASDLKAINDLQARIQVENGMLANEQIKLQSMNAVLQQQMNVKGQTEAQKLLLMTQKKY